MGHLHGADAPVSDSSPARSVRDEFQTPRAAAIAGILFALIMGTVVTLVRLASPFRSEPGIWLTDHSHRAQITLAITLVPYAGIAFLWFIGVIRSQLGAREDRLFATVFLGSGLLFVAMLFAGAAVMGGLLVLYDDKIAVAADTLSLASALSAALLLTFGIRMAAVFTLVVTNLGRRAEISPRWLVILGYITGVVLLFIPANFPWASMVFPAWVLVLSCVILFRANQSAHSEQATE